MFLPTLMPQNGAYILSNPFVTQNSPYMAQNGPRMPQNSPFGPRPGPYKTRSYSNLQGQENLPPLGAPFVHQKLAPLVHRTSAPFVAQNLALSANQQPAPFVTTQLVPFVAPHSVPFVTPPLLPFVHYQAPSGSRFSPYNTHAYPHPQAQKNAPLPTSFVDGKLVPLVNEHPTPFVDQKTSLCVDQNSHICVDRTGRLFDDRTPSSYADWDVSCPRSEDKLATLKSLGLGWPTSTPLGNRSCSLTSLGHSFDILGPQPRKANTLELHGSPSSKSHDHPSKPDDHGYHPYKQTRKPSALHSIQAHVQQNLKPPASRAVRYTTPAVVYAPAGAAHVPFVASTGSSWEDEVEVGYCGEVAAENPMDEDVDFSEGVVGAKDVTLNDAESCAAVYREAQSSEGESRDKEIVSSFDVVSWSWVGSDGTETSLDGTVDGDDLCDDYDTDEPCGAVYDDELCVSREVCNDESLVYHDEPSGAVDTYGYGAVDSYGYGAVDTYGYGANDFTTVTSNKADDPWAIIADLNFAIPDYSKAASRGADVKRCSRGANVKAPRGADVQSTPRGANAQSSSRGANGQSSSCGANVKPPRGADVQSSPRGADVEAPSRDADNMTPEFKKDHSTVTHSTTYNTAAQTTTYNTTDAYGYAAFDARLADLESCEAFEEDIDAALAGCASGDSASDGRASYDAAHKGAGSWEGGLDVGRWEGEAAMSLWEDELGSVWDDGLERLWDGELEGFLDADDEEGAEMVDGGARDDGVARDDGAEREENGDEDGDGGEGGDGRAGGGDSGAGGGDAGDNGEGGDDGDGRNSKDDDAREIDKDEDEDPREDEDQDEDHREDEDEDDSRNSAGRKTKERQPGPAAIPFTAAAPFHADSTLPFHADSTLPSVNASAPTTATSTTLTSPNSGASFDAALDAWHDLDRNPEESWDARLDEWYAPLRR